MKRQRLDLPDEDVVVLARVLGTDGDSLQSELDRRPLYVSDILRRPEVADAVLGAPQSEQLGISPLLFFAVLIHRSADDLTTRDWVDDWVGPGSRLPVFDVEPLLEFADAPGRLLFTARLLIDFAMPAKGPVPADRLDLEDLVSWLAAAEPADQTVLLRQLGDLALFQAGVFPDSMGATRLSAAQAEHLGRSVQMTDEQLEQLVDEWSTTPGLDALEMLSSAWYRAAAESSDAAPVLLRDVANRIRAARRFLNYVADHYLHHLQPRWAPGV
jgi:hypothetical protein